MVKQCYNSQNFILNLLEFLKLPTRPSMSGWGMQNLFQNTQDIYSTQSFPFKMMKYKDFSHTKSVHHFSPTEMSQHFLSNTFEILFNLYRIFTLCLCTVCMIPTTIWSIVMKFCIDVYGPQRMNLAYVGTGTVKVIFAAHRLMSQQRWDVFDMEFKTDIQGR